MRLISDEALAIATIWQEARGESFQGKIAVGEVILNRIKLGVFSDGTVAGTVLAPLQFSGWNTKDPNRIPSMRLDDFDPKVRECKDAWAAALSGSSLTYGATHYFNPSVVLPLWSADMKKTTSVGSHDFYKAP